MAPRILISEAHLEELKGWMMISKPLLISVSYFMEMPAAVSFVTVPGLAEIRRHTVRLRIP